MTATSSATSAPDLRLVPAPADPARRDGAGAPAADPATTLAPAAEPTIRAVVVDSRRLVRAGIRALLEDERDMAVSGEAATADEAIDLVRRTRADVVVIDAALAGTDGHDGLEATRRILAETPPGAVRILILTDAESETGVVEALHAGASGLLMKDSDAGELARAVRAVAHGDAPLSPRLMSRVIGRLASLAPRTRHAPTALDELTPREREVMALVARGLRNSEIAERLVVSPATAKTHVSRALCKLGARDRAQLVVLAYECGLVRAGDGNGDREAPAVGGAPARSAGPGFPHAVRPQRSLRRVAA